ncbi:HAD-IA family hydrolase [Aliikangiella maris]|uniref:HAD-IA family hydrolase n=2 Tax=Aliikangiella maris TaxID=3162458 RepID=A0ABV3ML80_9GAMM
MSILKNKYSFVIFDWDGTLMDSTGRIISAMQATARNLEIPVPDVESVRGIIGLSMTEVIPKLFPTLTSSRTDELLSEYRYQYVESDQTPSPLFDGVKEHLDWLKQQDVKIAIATGKARAGLDRVLHEVDLHSYFDFTICADESESKPNPKMVFELLESANKSATESLLIGDSVHDISMANNANVDSVAVTSGASDFHQLDVLAPKAILENVIAIEKWFAE